MATSPRNSPTRKPRRAEIDPEASATGLAAKLNRAAKTGKMPKVAERPIVGNKDVASSLFGGRGKVPGPMFQPEASVAHLEPEPEEDWEAELPPIDPADLASALGNSLNSRAVNEADVDRLWDWVRVDDDKGKSFLGGVPRTSTELRKALGGFGPHLYALEDTALEGEVHIGFAAVQLFEPNRAAVHLYLAKESRGEGRRLMPQLMAMAEGAFPGRVFVIITEDSAAARLYRSIGFSASFLLTWVPKPEPEPIEGEIEPIAKELDGDDPASIEE